MLNQVLVELAKFNTIILDGNIEDETYTINGGVFTKHLHKTQSILPGLTQGRGVLASNSAGYRHDGGNTSSK